jgi:hypothetical protein
VGHSDYLRQNYAASMIRALSLGRGPCCQSLLQEKLERCSIYGEPILINLVCPLSAILSSLTAFLAAGARPPTPLAKAIVLVLVLKFIGIAGIKVFMFPDSAQPVVDATAMAHAIGPSTSLP